MIVFRTLMKRVPSKSLMDAKAMKPALLAMIRSHLPSYRMVGYCIIVRIEEMGDW